MTRPGSGHLIWLDGRLVDAAGPQINVTDRSFQLGDGLFETARARRGVVIELDEHFERLRAGCLVLGLNLAASDDQLADGIAALLAAEGLDGNGVEASRTGEGGPIGDAGTIGDAALRIARGSQSSRWVAVSQ